MIAGRSKRAAQGAGAGAAGPTRARCAGRAPAVAALGRRAAARRHRARHRQRAGGAARGRAHRQPRPRKLRTRCSRRSSISCGPPGLPRSLPPTTWRWRSAWTGGSRWRTASSSRSETDDRRVEQLARAARDPRHGHRRGRDPGPARGPRAVVAGYAGQQRRAVSAGCRLARRRGQLRRTAERQRRSH